MTNGKLMMAIDLLWVKHNKIGGVESYIRNILDGLKELSDDFAIKLLVSNDNGESFELYESDPRFQLVRCNVESENVPGRILWQNRNLGRKLNSLGIKTCFEPHNYIPTVGVKNIRFITTIHDMQLAHYPGNFSKKKVVWFRYNWKNTLKNSKSIVAISNAVKNDINHFYPGFDEKLEVIYNPIIVSEQDCAPANLIFEKYGIAAGEYYYTVSSLHPHKNLETLIKVFDIIKKQNLDLPKKLLISGIGGSLQEKFVKELSDKGLTDTIKLTGFVENSERNALYKNAKAFLFPSVFEGFGMPPIEALKLGTPVVTTRRSCLEEVTQGKANYVDDPFDPDEWILRMKDCLYRDIDFTVYDKERIAHSYYSLFNKIAM